MESGLGLSAMLRLTADAGSGDPAYTVSARCPHRAVHGKRQRAAALHEADARFGHTLAVREAS